MKPKYITQKQKETPKKASLMKPKLNGVNITAKKLTRSKLPHLKDIFKWWPSLLGLKNFNET